jgi:TonB family protein
MFFSRILTILLLAGAAAGQDAQVGGPEMDALADKLAKAVTSAPVPVSGHKVLVLGFTYEKHAGNAAGDYLAERLSEALAAKLNSREVVATKQFRTYLLSVGLSPFDLDEPDAAEWNAGEVGADLMVLGEIRSSRHIELKAKLIRLSDHKTLTTASIEFQPSPDIRVLLSKRIDWPATPKLAVSCFGSRHDISADAFKAAGISQPRCIRCPNPNYPDKARAARYQGNVKLDVVVNEQGRVASIAVVKPDPYGLSELAVKAVRGWQLQPALLKEQPVAVCVQVEVTFAMY